jgi:hypothetical protein
MPVTNLNFKAANCDPIAILGINRVIGYVHGHTRFFSSHGSSANARFSALRSTLSRQPQNKNFLLSRSIPLYGICPANLSRKPERYRNLSTYTTKKALPHGYSWRHGSQYIIQCQQGTRLAYLCRFCTVSHSDSQNTLCKRRYWSGAQQYRLCTRCNDHRSLFVRLPMGSFSQNQSSNSDGKMHDVNVLDILLPEPGAFYVMDRGYVDFKRLYELHLSSAFFVTRAKAKMKFRRVYSRTVDKSLGLKCDQTIRLTGFYAAKDYPETLRRIKYYDSKTNKMLIFLTSNFSLPAMTIADLYRSRWQVELFFKWIKQHLRIKSFFGTSENAVKSQIWIAVAVYVQVAIIKKRLNLDASLYAILQILSVTIFENIPLNQLLMDNAPTEFEMESANQLILFD